MKRSVTFFSLLSVTLLFAVSLSAQPGALDKSFGENGTVMLPLYRQGQFYASVAEAAALQADGKLLVSGRYDLIDPWAAQQRFLLRLQVDGRPDSTFGQAGWVLPEGQQAWKQVLPPHHLPNGQFLVAGVVYASETPDQTLAIVRRYQANGQRDSSFGQQGQLRLPLGNQLARLARLYVDPTGQLMLLGLDGNQRLMLLNLSRQEGQTEQPQFVPASFPSVSGLRIEQIVPQPDGHILIAGSTQPSSSQPNSNIVLLRLDETLQLDQGFGQQGIATVDLSPNPQHIVRETLNQLALQADGRILLVGSHRSSLNRVTMLVVRLTASGQMDRSFGTQGAYYLPMHRPYFPLDVVEGAAEQVAVQADGRILVSGKWGPYQNEWLTTVFRLRPNGTLDPSFGQQGITLGTPDSMPVQQARMAVQPDGHITLVGAAEDSLGRHSLTVSRVMTAEPQQTTHVRQARPAVDEVRIFPNPVGEAPFQIAYQLERAQPVSVEVLTLQGQRVATLLQQAQRGAGTQQETVQLTQSLTTGHYLLQVVTPQGRQVTKLIKR